MKENNSIAPDIDVAGTGASSLGNLRNPGLAFCKIWTHVATAIERLLLDDAFSFSINWIDFFLYYEQFHLIFSNSGYGNTDYLLRRILVDSKSTVNEGMISFLYGPHSEMSVNQLFEVIKDPGWRLRIASWIISVPCWINPKGHSIRNEFITRFPDLLSDAVGSGGIIDLGLLYGPVWMYSGYSDNLNREKIHLSINRVSQLLESRIKLLKSNTIHQRKCAPRGNKHVVLVVLEKFTSGHAMTRCFENMIRELAREPKIKLVALGLTPDSTDDYTKSIFDKYYGIVLDHGSNRTIDTVKKAAKIIRDISPDSIWYPSIGMSDSAAFLAALRLAPVQGMSFGHPASTWSKTIDIAFVSKEEAKYIDRSLLSEHLVAFHAHNVMELRSEIDGEDIPEKWNFLHGERSFPCFGVSASAMKLNYRFVHSLSRIARQLKRARFVFFLASHSAGQQFRYMEVEIKKIMGSNCEILPSLPYDSYIDKLSECDFTLTPVPFGHSNTFVDSILSGALPISSPLYMDVAGANDRALHERAGIERFCFDTEEELINAALMFGTDRLSPDDKEHLVRVSPRTALKRLGISADPDSPSGTDDKHQEKTFAQAYMDTIHLRIGAAKTPGF